MRSTGQLLGLSRVIDNEATCLFRRDEWRRNHIVELRWTSPHVVKLIIQRGGILMGEYPSRFGPYQRSDFTPKDHGMARAVSQAQTFRRSHLVPMPALAQPQPQENGEEEANSCMCGRIFAVVIWLRRYIVE